MLNKKKNAQRPLKTMANNGEHWRTGIVRNSSA